MPADENGKRDAEDVTAVAVAPEGVSPSKSGMSSRGHVLANAGVSNHSGVSGEQTVTGAAGEAVATGGAGATATGDAAATRAAVAAGNGIAAGAGGAAGNGVTTAPADSTTGTRAQAPAVPLWRRGWVFDLAAVVSFVLLAFWVTYRIWLHPSFGLSANKGDQAFFEWMMAHGAQVLTDHVNPFFSDQMNVPAGVNMMANTSVLAVSIPMAPVTLAFGPHISFNIFVTGALILTGVAWYFVLSRYLVRRRGAAWIGAAFCAFAPGMVSQANGHPNIVAQFLVPVLIWRVFALRRPGKWLRNGLLLAIVVVWQAFINLEILFMTAVCLGIFIAVLAVARRDVRADWRPFLLGLGTAGAASLVVLAYPLYLQMFGRQSYSGLPPDIRNYGANLLAYFSFSRESLAGDVDSARGLAQNAAEENSFFGWPLVLLVLAIVVWLRRNVAVVALAIVGFVVVSFSLGPEIKVGHRQTGIPWVWKLFTDVPVLSSAVPTRWALATTPVVGLLLAIAVAELLRRVDLAGSVRKARTMRFGAAGVLALALVPIAPTALPAGPLPATPAFVSEGMWREYTTGNRSILFVPPPSSGNSDALRWSAQTGNDMAIARGYFLVPNGPERIASFTGPSRNMTRYFARVNREKNLTEPTPKELRDVRLDLLYWRAGAVVLPPRRDEVKWKMAMTNLLGIEAKQIGGAWVWDVRPITDKLVR